jgi:hypothetical protein
MLQKMVNNELERPWWKEVRFYLWNLPEGTENSHKN